VPILARYPTLPQQLLHTGGAHRELLCQLLDGGSVLVAAGEFGHVLIAEPVAEQTDDWRTVCSYSASVSVLSLVAGLGFGLVRWQARHAAAGG